MDKIKNIIVRKLDDQDNKIIQKAMIELKETTASKCVVKSMEQFLYYKKQTEKLEKKVSLMESQILEYQSMLEVIKRTFSMITDWKKFHKKKVAETKNFLNGYWDDE